MNRDIQKAEFLTRLIIAWHSEIGTELAHESLEAESSYFYLKRVATLAQADPRRIETMREVAHEQLSGSFARFSGERMPHKMLHILETPYQIEAASDASLGEIAEWILEIVSETRDQQRDANAFRLPTAWPDNAVRLEPARVELSVGANEHPRDVIKRYFADLESMRAHNLGGEELMVSMNEDVLSPPSNYLEDRPYEHVRNHIVVYDPASFGFHLVTVGAGEDNIVIQTVKGNIEILNVVIGADETAGGNEPEENSHGDSCDNRDR